MRLQHGPVVLELAPAQGGGVTRFDFAGLPVFAPARGPLATDLASAPLVPFHNRIAFGRFVADGRTISLPPFPPEAHALHGQGWTSAWTVADAGHDSARLVLDHPADSWPWHYRAEQLLRLADDGYRHGISVTNLGDRAMPAGLGLHPWLPCDAATRYTGLHHGEWQVTRDLLPTHLVSGPVARDWWNGAPVATRVVDNCYTGRAGDLVIDWPGRGLRLTMIAAPLLRFTQVFVPADAAFFCVEPVSNIPDAVNRTGDTGLVWLAPGATLHGEVVFRVAALQPPS